LTAGLALVQAGAALALGVSGPLLPVFNAVESSGPRTPGARPILGGERSTRRGAGAGAEEGTNGPLFPAHLRKTLDRVGRFVHPETRLLT
jgi:hypothetical protein